MAVQVTKRHPIRGFIWGIFFGLGLALIAIGQGYAALGTLPPLILLIVGIVLGTLWGFFAPAKKPKGEPPRQPVPVEKAEPSRFDDFTELSTSAAAPVPAALDDVADGGVIDEATAEVEAVADDAEAAAEAAEDEV